MTTFPSADDYVRAVQDPGRSFVEPALKSAVFPTHPLLGVPMPASGSSAVVFKAVIGGQEQAVRFFTRHEVSTKERYGALNRHFLQHRIAAHMATSEWVDDAINVNGRPWPAVRMQWVNGRTLDAYISDLVEGGDTATLSGLVDVWRDMVRRLQGSGFAHGDLQHGNVLVDDKGALRLVDFDCAWLESFDARSAPSESGHRNYQRTDAPWGRWMDTFPALVIHTSLLAVAKKPTMWDSMHNGENLLFESKDFTAPGTTPVWRELERLQDQRVAAAAARLQQCCETSWQPATGMESLLERRWWEQIGDDAVKTVSTPKPMLAQQKTVIKPATSANKASSVPKPPLVTKMGNGGTWPLKPTIASTHASTSPFWLAHAGARTSGVAGRPATSSQTPAGNPATTNRKQRDIIAFGVFLLCIVGIIVSIIAYTAIQNSTPSSFESSDGLTDTVPAASPYTTLTKFNASSSEELGSCSSIPNPSSRITAYDTDVTDCNGYSSPYSYRLIEYDQASPRSWLQYARATYPSLQYHISAACYSTYTATQGGFNYVFFVYKSTPFVAIAYASVSSQSLSDLADHSFAFTPQGC